jgi:hypothetical protein
MKSRLLGKWKDDEYPMYATDLKIIEIMVCRLGGCEPQIETRVVVQGTNCKAFAEETSGNLYAPEDM